MRKLALTLFSFLSTIFTLVAEPLTVQTFYLLGPVPGVTVTVYRLSRVPSLEMIASGESNQEGLKEFDEISRGQYLIHGSLPGFLSAYQLVSVPGPKVNLYFQVGEWHDPNYPDRVHGEVFLPDGSPAENCRVMMTPISFDDQREQTFTDEMGRYEFYTFHNGQYAVGVFCPGYVAKVKAVNLWETTEAKADFFLEEHLKESSSESGEEPK